jgi:predicted nuclease of predicted toxin-antitoxin system
MIKILVDYNIIGHSALLLFEIRRSGWSDLKLLEMLNFNDVGLASDASDREVWRFAQENEMILLTANRNMDGEDSLEQTIRRECNENSLPVVTISQPDRLMEKSYREICAVKLIEVVLYLENFQGVGRLYIP